MPGFLPILRASLLGIALLPALTVGVAAQTTPEITISCGTSCENLVEGENYFFTVNANPAPTGSLTVNLTITDAPGADFATQTSRTITFSSGETSKTSLIPTTDDMTAEPSGPVMITVASGTGYTVGTPSSISRHVADNDGAAGLVVSPSSLTIDEGGTAAFTVRTNTSPSTIAVVSVSSDNTNVTVNPAAHTFNTANWYKNKTVAVTSTTVDRDAADETATITLSSNFYSGGSATVSVTVDDNSAAPTVANAIQNQSATVGVAFSYQVPADTFSDPDSGDTLTYSAPNLPSWLSFDASTRTLSGTPASTGTSTVTVRATDDSTETWATDDMFDIVVGAAPIPEITVARTGNPVTEGTGVTFTVSANPAPVSNLTVNYTVGDAPGADFVSSTNQGDKTVTMTTGGTATITVPTVADGNDEPSGPITVTIDSGTGYTVGTAGSATETVEDNDATVVTLAGAAGDVTEGGTGTFTVSLGRGLVNGEVLAVPLTFGGTAARGTDYTTTCPSSLPGGVTCTNLDSGSATVTFTGPATGATATSVTLTLSATTDSVTETGGETVAIGLGTLNANSGTNLDGGAAGTDNLADFSISDPPAAPNNAPTVANPIPDLTATVGTAFSYQFPANTFNDADGDALSYTATLGNGDPLPDWLGFSTRTLSGTPTTAGSLTVRVTANDGRGGTVPDDFRITVGDTSNADERDGPSSPVRESLVLLGRTLGLQSVTIINDRLTSPRPPGAIGHVAGQTLIGNGIDVQPAADVETDFITGDAMPIPASALETGTSFEFNGETGQGSRMSLWGRGTRSSFRNGTVTDGSATTLSFGTDRRHGDVTLGVMVSRSTGDIRYRELNGDGAIQERMMTTELTAVIPYGGMDLDDDLSMWGALGIGNGSLTLKPPDEGPEVTTDLDWHMVAGGMRGDLPSMDILPDADLTWRTDAVWTRTRTGEGDNLPAQSSRGIRLRAGLEMAWQHQMAGTSVLRPHVGIDIIHDGGDGDTGLGVTVAGGIDWLDPARGITVGISGHRVVHHADDAHEDWSVSVMFRLDPNPGSREGFSASAGHVVDLAAPDGPGSLSGSSPVVNRNWQMEAAHGTAMDGGRVGSSYARMNGTDDPERVRVGYRIEPDAAGAEDVTVDTWASSPMADGTTSEAAGIDLVWRW